MRRSQCGVVATSGNLRAVRELSRASLHVRAPPHRAHCPPPARAMEDAASAPPTPAASASSRLRRTLHSLRSPFRSGSPFHLSAIKRTGSTKSSTSDGGVPLRTHTNMIKKTKKSKLDLECGTSGSRSATDGSPSMENKKKEGRGSFVRRLGNLGRRRGGERKQGVARSAATRDMDASADPPPTEPSAEAQPVPIPDLAVEHPVSTKPFTKAAWKKRTETIMEKPVETPSPESALKRRIAFVAQASACLSEDHEDEGRGKSQEGSPQQPRLVSAAGYHSLSPSEQSRDTEEETYSDAMPPYGDLIIEKTGNGASTSASHAATPVGERREHLYKILVIGELGTGKTSIIKRYVHQFFSQHYRATIGVDFALKVLNWDANTVIRLQLWDIAGQERFGNMTRVYYKEAVGAFIVFDVTRVATFEAVLKWKNDLDAKVQLPDGSPIPCVLLANKCDQQKEGIVNTPAKMDEYCREKGFAGWFETSAKENINVEEAARSLVNKILLNDKLLHSNDIGDGEKFGLEHKIANGENPEGSSKSCAC